MSTWYVCAVGNYVKHGSKVVSSKQLKLGICVIPNSVVSVVPGKNIAERKITICFRMRRTRFGYRWIKHVCKEIAKL